MPRVKAFDPDAVLDRAVELFWRLGYEGCSMTRLLDFMGISRQSLYDTFGDKRRLYLASLARYRQNVIHQLIEIISSAPTGLAAIRTIFAWANDVVLESPERRSCLIANAAIELGQRDPEVRRHVAEHLRELEELFYATLVRAQLSGELSHERDVRAIARFLTNSLVGLGVLARGGASMAVLRDTISTTLSVVDPRQPVPSLWTEQLPAMG